MSRTPFSRASLAAFVALGLAQLSAAPAEAATMLGALNDGYPSIIYDYSSGEVLIDTEGYYNNTFVLDSSAGIFTGEAPVFPGTTPFQTDTDFRISQNFYSPLLYVVHNLGPVAEPQLSQAFLLADLTLYGNAGSHLRGPFDLVLRNTPEPSTFVLVALGLVGIARLRRRRPLRTMISFKE